MDIEQPARLENVLLQFRGFDHCLLNNQDWAHLNGDQPECHICQAEFAVGDLVSRVACGFGHIFHYICILGLLVHRRILSVRHRLSCLQGSDHSGDSNETYLRGKSTEGYKIPRSPTRKQVVLFESRHRPLVAIRRPAQEERPAIGDPNLQPPHLPQQQVPLETLTGCKGKSTKENLLAVLQIKCRI